VDCRRLAGKEFENMVNGRVTSDGHAALGHLRAQLLSELYNIGSKYL